jgi:hypothetical protein
MILELLTTKRSFLIPRSCVLSVYLDSRVHRFQPNDDAGLCLKKMLAAREQVTVQGQSTALNQSDARLNGI